MKLEEIRSQLLTQLQINLNYWDDVINKLIQETME